MEKIKQKIEVAGDNGKCTRDACSMLSGLCSFLQRRYATVLGICHSFVN